MRSASVRDRRLTPATSAVDAVVAQLVADVTALRDRVAALEGIVHHDAVDDRELLRTIVTAIQPGVLFSTRDLVEHATVHRELGRVLGGMRTKPLGKRLRAIVDVPLGDYVLTRVDRNNQGSVWAVQVTPYLHPPACVLNDPDAE